MRFGFLAFVEMLTHSATNTESKYRGMREHFLFVPIRRGLQALLHVRQ